MPHSLHYVVYASSITLPSALYKNTFLDIKKQANENNILSDITGFLCFKDGKFLQYFEGTELVCANLLKSLKNDERHKNLTLISRGAISNKRFKDWAMCCFSLDEQTYNLNSNFLDFDVFNWKERDIQEAIKDISNYRLTHQLNLPKTSYLKLLIIKSIHQHKTFLFVQIILLAIIIMTFMYFYYIK